MVSIDGKIVRRSKDTGKNLIHMVSAWANQMVVGQLSTDEKSNEITAVPELLAALDITEKIITEDAMSCQ
ncbi:MAG: ISAs1 family transposase [Oscillospiraceae bacterium]